MEVFVEDVVEDNGSRHFGRESLLNYTQIIITEGNGPLEIDWSNETHVKVMQEMSTRAAQLEYLLGYVEVEASKGRHVYVTIVEE